MVAVTYGVARTADRASKAKIRKKATTPGLLSRFMTAMMDARMRQAETELRIHRHLMDDDD
jgi:hypothetical protein